MSFDDEFEKKIVWIFTTSDRNLESFFELFGKNVSIMNEPEVDGLLNLPRWSQNKFLPKTRLQEDQPHMRYDYFFHYAYKNSWAKFLKSMILKHISSQYGTKNIVVIRESMALGASEIVSMCLPESKIVFLMESCKDVIKGKISALRAKEKKLSEFLKAKEKLKDKMKRQSKDSELSKIEAVSQSLAEKINELQYTIRKMTLNIQITRDAKNKHEDKIKKFEERIENRNKRIRELKNETPPYEEAISVNKKKINDFKAKINELEVNLEKISDRLENQESKIGKLKFILHEKEKKLKSLQSTLREKKERKKKIIDNISQYDSRIDKIGKETEKINAKIILEDTPDKRIALIKRESKLWSSAVKTYLKVHESRNGTNCRIVKIEDLSDAQKTKELMKFMCVNITDDRIDDFIQHTIKNDLNLVNLTDKERHHIKESADKEMRILGY